MLAVKFISSVMDNLGWGDVTSIEGDLSTDVRRVVRASNMVLQAMQADKPWPELAEEGTLIIKKAESYTTQVGCEKGKALITKHIEIGDCVGCLFQLEGTSSIYRILEETQVTFLLDRPWVDDDIGREATFIVGRDRYEMPADYDRMKLNTIFNTTPDTPDLTLVDEDHMGMSMQDAIVPADPTEAYIGGRSPIGRAMLHLNTIPDRDSLLRYKYLRKHPNLERDSDEVLYPPRYHLAIIDAVVARLSSDIDNKPQAQKQANSALQERVRQDSNPSTGQTRMRFTPKMKRRRARRRR